MKNSLETLAITAIIATMANAQTRVWDGTADTTWYTNNAKMTTILPNNEKTAEMKIIIYDNVGNIVFYTNACGNEISWDLRNSAGRIVANGTYLVIAEAKDRNGRVYNYSARLGVKR